MPYPFFDINSIKERCNDDIKKFKAIPEYNTTFDSTNKLNTNAVTTSAELKTIIGGLIREFESLIGPTKLKDFDYPHDIGKKDTETQKKLWILRTYLFYQLLIFATLIMSNKVLFDDVYKDKSPKRTFRVDITPAELKNYKMGIFGSLTPTSDIDIGIQYSGENAGLNALSYIVSIFEDMFLFFLEKNSLSLDIETYADMMTIPNPDTTTNKISPDLFYLDTSYFTIDHLKKMLPYAGASILRNHITAKTDLGTTQDKVPGEIDSFQFNSIFEIKPIADGSATEATASKDIKIYLKTDTGNDLSLNQALDDTAWQNEAKTLTKDYMSRSYNDAREIYYKLVEDAEKSTQEARTTYKEKKTNVDTNKICDIMQKIGKALIYRAESYTCAPTVMHVVRVLQANKDQPEKYKTTTPDYCKTKGLTEPLCDIGKYGYVISMLEQIGYINRFKITYCLSTGHLDEAKCAKKLKKYKERYDNAITIYNTKKTFPVTGGKRKRRTKKDLRKKKKRTIKK
jgi:hypothetical protein